MLVDVLWLLLLLCTMAAGFAASYVGVLTLLSCGRPRRAAVPPAGRRPTRFALVVPAHDEAANIAATVRSLLAIEYPPDAFRVLVVADNCTDATAANAAAAGAEVLVRTDPARRSKGHALAFAFARLLDDTAIEAVVVVDADSRASPDLLHALHACIAEGDLAVQVRYGVQNPMASWRTRLQALSFGMFHDVRSLGRERLRLSCGLRGNGMCFTRAALQRVPYAAHGLVEDVEHGIALARAGIRVRYLHEAEVLGDMPAGEAAARSQRIRWEGGRLQLARRVPGLCVAALRQRSLMLFDIALDLAMPPLGYAALLLVAATAGHLGFYWWSGHGARGGPLLVGFFALFALHVLRGLHLSRIGWRNSWVLLTLPWFVAWKVLFTLGRRPRSWVRTDRAAPADGGGVRSGKRDLAALGADDARRSHDP
jgi:cellulose synthase/poly-beta-1,6-N-acetylglucosamine synthase-like glycosyltransferase